MQTRLEIVRIGTLRIDPNYQRVLDVRRVEQMAADWNDDLAGALTISRRNGSSYVIDGQQRLAAARTRLIAELPALIHDDLTPSQEAALFVGLNTGQRRPSFFDLYRARLAAGDEHAVWLNTMLGSLGLTFVDHQARKPSQIRSALAVWNLGRSDRRSAREALEVIIEAWPTDLRRFESLIIGGVAGFIHVYRDHPRYAKARLITKLAERPTRGLNQRMRELGSTHAGGTAMAASARQAVLEAYNRNLSVPLDAVTQAQLRNLSLGKRIWDIQ